MPYRWSGDAWVIHPSFQRQADAAFAIGEVRMMVEVEERSEASHRHEFAWLREAWLSLPEHLADQFPTVEHLRKRALIETGFPHETVIDCGTTAAALRVASYARGEDDFAHVVTRGPLVVVRKAKSQSRRAMAKDEWQASKTAILEWVAGLLDVAPATLAKQSEAA
jgi:hypothetical protein